MLNLWIYVSRIFKRLYVYETTHVAVYSFEFCHTNDNNDHNNRYALLNVRDIDTIITIVSSLSFPYSYIFFVATFLRRVYFLLLNIFLLLTLMERPLLCRTNISFSRRCYFLHSHEFQVQIENSDINYMYIPRFPSIKARFIYREHATMHEIN